MATKPAPAATRPPKAPPPRPLDPKVFDVVEHTLSNGLKVRLVESRGVPTVSYYTFFRAGSRNERPGITGIAHLFEHMMFNGAKKYGPKEFDRVLESAGGTSNAYTSNDLTVYHEDFASDALETVIDLESDRMRSLAISPENLESERGVVMEERRFRVDNDVPGMLDEALSASIWKAHPYHWPVIGWMRDIEAITRDDALAFFRTFYAPNNATIVAVGDLDPKKTIALIKKAYGDIPAGPAVPEVVDSEPEPTGERRVQVHYPSQAPSLMVGYRVSAAKHDDTFVLDLIQTALGAGEASRLTKRLVYDQELATNVSVDFGWRIDPSAFVIFAELPPGGDPRKVEAAIYEELEKVAKDGISELELRRGKNILRSHFVQEISTHGGRAHAIGHYELLLGDWRAALETLERYGSVKNADVKRVAAKYFSARNRSVAILVPDESEKTR
ncbi:M16 family metallopeptidase [Vulgatibacter incomptus]|uniref:M16 family metallopeptidase n=1 Tax=Vulgatibacter incomptus TaxID=1391653 RepID=UPI003B83969D